VPLFGEAKEKPLYDRLGKSPCTYRRLHGARRRPGEDQLLGALAPMKGEIVEKRWRPGTRVLR
jgi:hypothetical protein